MKILFCNKYNFRFSGTEAYLFEVMNLLRANGHEAELFSMADPRGVATPYDQYFVPTIDFKKPEHWPGKIRLATHAIYSRETRRRLRAMLAEFRPDIAHVRNIYHHLSPSLLWELKAQNVPVIYHINDFKLLCPSYNLVSRGEACELCRNGKFWHVLRSSCYPGLGARLTLAAEAYVHRWLGTYRRCVTRFLAPSEFVRNKFAEHGWDAANFDVLPHFQATPPVATRDAKHAPILYFGRLSAEKGVADLLHAMHKLPELKLVVAGDGPERQKLEAIAATLGLQNVVFAGHMAHEQLDGLIANSRFTILPSHAYETFGKTILESYAHARAVIATDLGSRRELIEPGRTGLLYEAGNIRELVGAISLLCSQPGLADEMGQAGREKVLGSFTAESHYRALIDVYQRAMTQNRRARSVLVQHASIRNAEAEVIQGRAVPAKAVRVAFIGGRGVVSKYSGIEAYYEEVGKHLAARGLEVTAYCRTFFTPRMQEHNGIRIVRLPTIRTKHLETVVHTLLSTVHAMFGPYDIVHYHALGPALFAFLPRLVGKKTVVTVQGLDWKRRKWGRVAAWVLRLGEGCAVKFPHRTMVVSKALQDHYWQQYGEETIYVPNGGLIREQQRAARMENWGIEAGRYILFLGRFSPEKGCHLLLEAYSALDTDVKLVMAGASSYCDEYSRQLKARANGQVKILDWVAGEALDELLTNAMVFVLPSDLEGLSLALLDAMGAGICVLASDVPENREVVADAGFTFRRGDVASLTERLRYLIAHPAARKSAGEAAQQRIFDTFQWPGIADAIERVYLEMMGWDEAKNRSRKPSASVAATEVAERRKAG